MKVYATKSQLEDFKESVIWKDIKRELKMWQVGFKQESLSMVEDAAETNPSTATVLMHLGDINGRVKAVEYMLALPDIFISILEDKEDDTRHERTDRSEVNE